MLILMFLMACASPEEVKAELKVLIDSKIIELQIDEAVCMYAEPTTLKVGTWKCFGKTPTGISVSIRCNANSYCNAEIAN